ncbi:MAG: hypothetical protein KJ767_03965 [Nanoarchaeota archaeon]|nr:hypothetical protein [Nanoarchaeota archaeon]
MSKELETRIDIEQDIGQNKEQSEDEDLSSLKASMSKVAEKCLVLYEEHITIENVLMRSNIPPEMKKKYERKYKASEEKIQKYQKQIDEYMNKIKEYEEKK